MKRAGKVCVITGTGGSMGPAFGIRLRFGGSEGAFREIVRRP
jgi:hypothetical protein